MLDQLRAMGVFACVVEKNSFSGAARQLGITTSAVSQQIRSLEQDMEVILLNRSTRKLSLTEAGQAFFYSCKEMLSAAERGKVRINELRDDLIGELRISSMPDLCANHVIPALSHWMATHRGLSVHIETSTADVKVSDAQVDIALRLDPVVEDSVFEAVPLMQIEQTLIAAPSYINQNSLIAHPQDLKKHEVLPLSHMKNHEYFQFKHVNTGEQIDFELKSRYNTNNSSVAKSICLQGNGIAKMLYLDAQQELMSGTAVEVLPEWRLKPVTLYAVIPKCEQQSIKILRCIDTLKQYFSRISGGRVLENAS